LPSHLPHLDPTGEHRAEPVDPDIDLHDPGQRSELSSHPWTLPVIGAGGALGASARYGLELAWPHAPTQVPWATLFANVTGCLLLGIVMVAVTEAGQRHPLWRPFLGVGILGGYTTFSTYAVQVQQAIQYQHPTLALGYLVTTLAAALLAVIVGALVTRWLLAARARRRGRGPWPERLAVPDDARRDEGVDE